MEGGASQKREAQFVVDLTNEDETDFYPVKRPRTTQTHHQHQRSKWQPFYLTTFHGSRLPERCLGMRDVFSEEEGSKIEEFAIIAFACDWPWILSSCPQLRSVPGLLADADYHEQMPSQWSCGKVEMEDKFGSSHAKLILVFYKSGVRVVVSTQNFTEYEWGGIMGACYVEDFPRKSSESPTSTPYEQDLVAFLAQIRISQGKAMSHLDRIIKRLHDYDFSPAQVTFVASVPGRHKRDARRHWGHWRLREVLADALPTSDATDDAHSTLVMQSSSIGAPGKKEKFIDELAGSMSLEKLRHPGNTRHVDIEIIWPTSEFMRTCVLAEHAAGYIFCHSKHIFAEGTATIVSAALGGKKIVVTGVMESGREQVEVLVKSHGGKLVGSISGQTDYLIAGAVLEDGRLVKESNKYKQAQEKAVPIISEKQFFSLISAASGDAGKVHSTPVVEGFARRLRQYDCSPVCSLEVPAHLKMYLEYVVRHQSSSPSQSSSSSTSSSSASASTSASTSAAASTSASASASASTSASASSTSSAVRTELRWFLLTSANVSQAAWGCEQKGEWNQPHLYIKSFELGVCFLPHRCKRTWRSFSCTPNHPLLGIDRCHEQDATSEDGVVRFVVDYPVQVDGGPLVCPPHLDAAVFSFMTEAEQRACVVDYNLMAQQRQAGEVCFPIPFRIPARHYETTSRPWVHA